jgi:hypothetical protein
VEGIKKELVKRLQENQLLEAGKRGNLDWKTGKTVVETMITTIVSFLPGTKSEYSFYVFDSSGKQKDYKVLLVKDFREVLINSGISLFTIDKCRDEIPKELKDFISCVDEKSIDPIDTIAAITEEWFEEASENSPKEVYLIRWYERCPRCFERTEILVVELNEEEKNWFLDRKISRNEKKQKLSELGACPKCYVVSKYMNFLSF